MNDVTRRTLLAAAAASGFLRRQQAPARNPMSRPRNRGGLDTAAPMLVGVTSPEIDRIPICSFRPPLITARFLICVGTTLMTLPQRCTEEAVN